MIHSYISKCFLTCAKSLCVCYQEVQLLKSMLLQFFLNSTLFLGGPKSRIASITEIKRIEMYCTKKVCYHGIFKKKLYKCLNNFYRPMTSSNSYPNHNIAANLFKHIPKMCTKSMLSHGEA